MANFNVFFTCDESPRGDYVQVEADTVQGAEEKAWDYATSHDAHNFKVEAVVPT